MSSRIQTFWCEPAPRARQRLRRYSRSDSGCTDAYSYHNAYAILGEVDFALETGYTGDSTQPFDRADPRWPTKCERCDYAFQPDDEWQHNLDRLYRRADTGELLAHDDMPAGASYDATWYHDFWVGRDGMSLTVVLPDGTHWHVDSRATNCDLPDDTVHRCWVREGDPRACNVTAGKNGVTCTAGGGSIQSPAYHGHLRNGVLEECG